LKQFWEELSRKVQEGGMTLKRETILENLNSALTKLVLSDDKVVLIGEDIGDPYGGSFKVSKGISTAANERVISTPISEEGFTDMAAGMAMMGYKPIVDLMFSDFTALIFDPILNFASKYISMYGKRNDLQMIVRCANGGYRGYGPTHSQSMQKYFLGIPNLSLYELTPFHENSKVFQRMFEEKNPCIFFEEKVIYSNKRYQDGIINDLYHFEFAGDWDNWAVAVSESEEAQIAIISHGGLTNACLEAVEQLLLEEEIECKIFIPSKLYPCDIETIMEDIKKIGRVLIVEESTAGATWGTELLANIYTQLKNKNEVIIKLLSSKASIIPASAHYEKEVLVSEKDMVNEVLAMLEE
jgi:pyruvate/2-oxoglutarate/acetoin dehydrogenase E1 component